MEKLQLSRLGRLVKLPKELYAYEPTHASRYWILATVLAALGATNTRVLDVGGKKGLLRFFPGLDPTIIDIEESDEPNFVQGDALHMPFKDGEFAYAVSGDVLEHIPKNKRERFLIEMLRVSSRGVILCAPFDNPGNGELEQKMNDFHAHLTGQQHRWLREHIDNGLPSEKEVENILKKHGFRYTKFRHFSPQTWQAIVAQHLLHAAFGDSKQLEKMIHSLYRQYYEALCCMDFSDNGYRTFFWISKKGTPQVELPNQVDMLAARDAFFAANQSLTLAFMEYELREQRTHAQTKSALTQSKHKLSQALAELNAIKSSKTWRMMRHIQSVTKHVQPTKKQPKDV